MITVLSLSPAVDKIYYIDGFKAGGLYRVGNAVKSAGGKGINVARVASLLNEPVCLLGFKAGDTGDWLESQVKQLGIEVHFFKVEGESRTNLNIIDKAGGMETEILETGPYIDAGRVEAFLGVFLEILHSTKVLVLSGGLPMGIATGFYRDLIEKAKAGGVTTILDTSGSTLVEGVKANPFMIKPNLRELYHFSGVKPGDERETIALCRQIVSRGVKIVLASRGKEGALMVSEDGALKASVPEVEVVNTIGSGDSTVAGCAVALSRGLAREEMLRLAMACAVANTQFAEIGMVSRELVEQYRQKIRIDKVE